MPGTACGYTLHLSKPVLLMPANLFRPASERIKIYLPDYIRYPARWPTTSRPFGLRISLSLSINDLTPHSHMIFP